jgi:hypothetical protein
MCDRISDHDYHIGKGNWRVFDLPIERVFTAGRRWAEVLSGIERPWLCWHIDHDWSLVQQRLVAAFGWTPVVAGDPRAGTPPAIDGARLVDFNRDFGFKVMYPHFVIEFAFLFCDRLAFWHSDLLLREEQMAQFSDLFGSLPDGSLAATTCKGGLRDRLKFRQHRYWELLGCTTRSAGRAQFETGCGWWMNFHLHPNCPDRGEFTRRSKYSYEYGTGIMYWSRRYKGKVVPISDRSLEEGHFTRINVPRYRTAMSLPSQRNLAVELPVNYDIESACGRLALKKYL